MVCGCFNLLSPCNGRWRLGIPEWVKGLKGCIGDGQGCARPWAGGTPALPGGPSSIQQTGNMIYITPRNRARGHLQASRITPPLRGSRRSRAEWRRLMRRRGDAGLTPPCSSLWRHRVGPPTGPTAGGAPPGNAGGAPPGNAGVPPASLFLAGGGGATAQHCRQPATLPA